MVDPLASELVGAPVKIVGPDQRPPEQITRVLPTWQRNAAPMPPIDTLPWVAVVLDDLGLDEAVTRRVIALPPPLTLSFLPYGKNVAAHAAAARAAGHEVMVHVPMEPNATGTDPGPNALLADLTDTELQRRLVQAIQAVPGAVGINNHMGSRLTRDMVAMDRVMTVLLARGLLFLDSRTTAQSVALSSAVRNQVPAVERDVFIDHQDDPEAIRLQLAALEQVALGRESAIGIGHPRPNTLDALAEWRQRLPVLGVTVVPLSAVLQKQTAAGVP